MLKVKYDIFGELQNNCFLITDEKTQLSALVDCTEYSEQMKRLIGDCKLEYILLTHGHFDHIGGVAELKRQTNAKVVISKEDEPMLASSRKSLAVFCGAEHTDVKADILVSDGDVLKLGESEIKVISTAGHTKGSVCYICDDSIFTGDTLFFCSCGRTDFPSGSSSDMMKSLKKIAMLDGDYTAYTGHDRITTLDFERKNNPYINNKI